MILQKNGVAYDLVDKTQIDAFIGSGWLPVEGHERKTRTEYRNTDTDKKSSDEPKGKAKEKAEQGAE